MPRDRGGGGLAPRRRRATEFGAPAAGAKGDGVVASRSRYESLAISRGLARHATDDPHRVEAFTRAALELAHVLRACYASSSKDAREAMTRDAIAGASRAAHLATSRQLAASHALRRAAVATLPSKRREAFERAHAAAAVTRARDAKKRRARAAEAEAEAEAEEEELDDDAPDDAASPTTTTRARDLPDDVLRAVFDRLNPWDLGRCAATCARWRALVAGAERAWKRGCEDAATTAAAAERTRSALGDAASWRDAFVALVATSTSTSRAGARDGGRRTAPAISEPSGRAWCERCETYRWTWDDGGDGGVAWPAGHRDSHRVRTGAMGAAFVVDRVLGGGGDGDSDSDSDSDGGGGGGGEATDVARRMRLWRIRGQ